MKIVRHPERSEGSHSRRLRFLRLASLAQDRLFAVSAAQDDGGRVLLYLLVAVAALARLTLHVAALPPYAGLDEVWHVARLSFVLQEGRNPDIRENSVPRYLASSPLRQVA